MALQNEIAAVTDGAHFVRADLHIHSFGAGGSYDVKDATMTATRSVDAAINEKLKVIAIADHNAIGNVRAALTHAAGKDILVVPAVELTTQQGHLLVYFPAIDNLEVFYGKQQISVDKKACHNTIPQCLQLAQEFKGVGILAHIDGEAGLEHAHPKFDAFKQEVINCGNLLGIEIIDPGNVAWSSHLDAHPDRKNCAAIRRTTLAHEADVHIAKVIRSGECGPRR